MRYNSIQIVTGIEVNSEVYFPKLREYCPSAKDMRAIFPQTREINLLPMMPVTICFVIRLVLSGVSFIDQLGGQ